MLLRVTGSSQVQQFLIPLTQSIYTLIDANMVRKIPIPSALIVRGMNLIYTGAYIILKPLGLAPAANAFLSGGLFGLLLLPVTAIYSIVYILREFILPAEGLWHDAVIYSVWGFVVWYLLSIIMDDAHCRVDDTCFRTPQNHFDRQAYELFKELFDYFPITCVPYSEKVTQQLATMDKQYVAGVHPHGIHCFPLTLLASPDTPFDQQFPGLVSGSAKTPKHPFTGLAATIMFKIPVVREFFLVFGYIDASRHVADAALDAGKSIFVVTGGEEESMYATSTGSGGQEDILVLKNRKGFVRLALKHGASLLPIFGVGNNDTFVRYNFAMGFRQWIQKTFKIALPIFHGRFFTPLPYHTPIKVIVGEPIHVPKPTDTNAKPDEKLVNEYHQKYIEALKEIHAKFADRPLRIV
ncbi:wax alcohol acyltransferase 2 [Seminavis robusta]|uniref:Acyltransferase n=1 Tax=Seminavis robusta TaxID=568900 RepID=A0A9N8D466_9STRA|nr:wax alcohol acyltransferase 2 [Seminavis robusta]|eukprot:Sro1_g000750.1 wax alcohol acyltransferase 2 (409) ;mRNA; r:208396-209622